MHPDEELRERLRGGQAPKAVVLTCSDSRMPPELIFDQARNLPLHLACCLLCCAYFCQFGAFGDHLLWCVWGHSRAVLLAVKTPAWLVDFSVPCRALGTCLWCGWRATLSASTCWAGGPAMGVTRGRTVEGVHG